MMGSAFALTSALFWAVAVILFKKAGDVFSPVTLNLYKSLVALCLVSLTMLILGIPFFPDVTLNQVLLLSVSGFLGITLADVFFFMALNRLGAGLVAVVECLYLPSVLFFSFILLGERLGPGGTMGSFLVLSAVAVGSVTRAGMKQEMGISRETLVGMGAGLLAMLFLSFGIVMVKEVLEQTNVFWATLVRVLAGCIPLFGLVLVHPRRRQFLNELKFSRAWLSALPASVCGNFLALVCWVAGMKYTSASQAAILNQMSTIFIFILAAVWLKEKITPQRTCAIGLALTGAYLTMFT